MSEPDVGSMLPPMRVYPILLVAFLSCGDDGPATTPPPCGRILEAKVTNARDLGGVAIDGGTVSCGTLYRGGDLTGLSSCDDFDQLGVATVIDLRAGAVQTNEPPPACVSNSAQLVSAAMPKLVPDTPANYIALLDETAAIASLFDALGSSTAYPVYFHCVIGRDRASVAAALVLRALGASRTAVLDEFALSESAGVAVKPACMEAFLDELEDRGGIESFLTSAGVTGPQLETLRRMAVE